jgi:TolA-binding protein
MKKMYTNKPIIESSAVTPGRSVVLDDKKRIQNLEDEVRQLKEQLNKMASALALNSRQIRRQNTDIHNVNTVLRNR